MTDRLVPLGAVAMVLLAGAGVFVLAPGAGSIDRTPGPEPTPQPDRTPQLDEVGGTLGSSSVSPPVPEPANVTTFESAEAFAEYLWRARDRPRGGPDAGRVAEPDPEGTPGPTPMATGTPVDVATEAADGGDAGGAAPPARYSGTNVQVEGVGEPDLVKTDGDRT